MPDKPSEQKNEDAENSITVADAIRLKHSLNSSITWGNSDLNALELERIRKDYADWNGHRNYWLIGVLLACIVGHFALPDKSFWQIPLDIIGFLCLYTLLKREGHAEGYVDGYDAGHEAGIHKALGIKPEDLAEMNEVANDMKIDTMLVQKMDERDSADKSSSH
jgi:hypothetical protein